jgi:uncharacterized protein DUF3160
MYDTRALRSLIGSSRAALLFAALGCAGDGAQKAADTDPGAPTPGGPAVLEPGQTPLPGIQPGATASARFAVLAADVERLSALDAAGLEREYPMAHAPALAYTPRSAEFMDRVQASALALNEAELARLDQNGFVVSSRQSFPTFLRGYAAIYMEHLPVFVSADALLDALHRSYDAILSDIELQVLVPTLEELLRGMLGRVASSGASSETQADARVYLEVALGLLDPGGFTPSAPAAALVAKARAAQGIETVTLFGVARDEDFTQFTPRGHYTEEPLSSYFRAMMWLGRVDLRLLETLSDGTVTFRRAQYEAMLALNALLDESAIERWRSIDGVVRAFVGESDSMTVPQIGALVADLGGPEAARAASDESVVQAIVAGGYGEQQIASHLMVNAGVVETLPLNRSFLLFGQRYVADSHVFSESVYDRVAERMLPSPLDAAFAALGNNQALRLNEDVRAFGELPGALGAMRRLIDDHDASFWDANLYNLWSSALRSLSPAPDSSNPSALGLPALVGTEAWGRRLLNAQLGSWAQLRHDTLLYAKQSYTGIPGCEFPDAYVEPNPQFFHAIERYAERGGELVALLPEASFLGPTLDQYFGTLSRTARMLAEMAEQQRTGTPFSEAQLAFINDAVRTEQVSQVCTTIEVPDGWYADLFYRREASIEEDLTIADVHTQPADEQGNIVGKVLHVGTSYPRLLTLTVDTCVGPRAYTGMSYAYHELVTSGFDRLTDERWRERISAGDAADVPWAQPFIAP